MSKRVQDNGGQACYFTNIVPCAGSFHNKYFDFDERALVNGVKAFSAAASELMSGNKQ